MFDLCLLVLLEPLKSLQTASLRDECGAFLHHVLSVWNRQLTWAVQFQSSMPSFNIISSLDKR